MFNKILAHRWKLIITLVVLSMMIGTAYTWFKSPEYLSSSTALPSSIYANDRSRLFNEHIQLLYSDLGSPDELDAIVGTGQLDTVYLAVTDQFNLFDHYRSAAPNAREKAAAILRSKSQVLKTGNGELTVRVWDTDRNLAPQLANAVMDELQRIHTAVRNAGNEHMISSLRFLLESTQKMNAATADSLKTKMEKIASIQKLIAEYETIAAVRSPALVVIEKARPSLRADRPKSLQIIAAAGIAALLLSILLAIYLDRNKTV